MSLIFNGTEITDIIYNGTSLESLVYNGVEVFAKGINYLCFENWDSNSIDIAFTKTGTISSSTAISYSTDKAQWTPYTFGNSVSIPVGGKVYWKGNNNSFCESSENYINFTSTGLVKASGSIMTLLDETDVLRTIPSSGCFSNIFDGCFNLVTPPEFPATTLQDDCYAYAFAHCTNLGSTPSLPATVLSDFCYNQMFAFCINIEEPSVMSHITSFGDQSCSAMYVGCANLKKLPIINATYFDFSSCNGMFQACLDIKMSLTQTGDYQTAYRIPMSGTGTEIDSFYGMFLDSGGTFTGTPTINTTYYTSNALV